MHLSSLVMSRGKKRVTVGEPLRYGVSLRNRVITRFRYPESASVPGEAENHEREGEIRLASHIFAVLDEPAHGASAYAWNEHSYNSAHHIANVIGGHVVFLTEAGVEEIDMYKLVAGSPDVRPKGSLPSDVAEEPEEEQPELFE